MKKKLLHSALVLLVLFVVAGCSPKVAKNYAAESVTKFKGKAQESKIYFSGDKWRVESERRGQDSIMIVRADKGIAWLLMPQQKMYMETKLKKDMMMGQTEKLPGEVKREKVGQEKVSGIPCTKYMITYKVEGREKPMQVYQWLSKDKIAMKSAGIDGSWSTEYVNIKLGKQPDSLFELPKGYKKFELPANVR